jgi:hypothetical protein
MVETGSIRLEKNRHGSVQGKYCQKIREIFYLTLFWYSPTYYHPAISADILHDICIGLIFQIVGFS